LNGTFALYRQDCLTPSGRDEGWCEVLLRDGRTMRFSSFCVTLVASWDPALDAMITHARDKVSHSTLIKEKNPVEASVVYEVLNAFWGDFGFRPFSPAGWVGVNPYNHDTVLLPQGWVDVNPYNHCFGMEVDAVVAVLRGRFTGKFAPCSNEAEEYAASYNQRFTVERISLVIAEMVSEGFLESTVSVWFPYTGIVFKAVNLRGW
jgi:hypothetical protein